MGRLTASALATVVVGVLVTGCGSQDADAPAPSPQADRLGALPVAPSPPTAPPITDQARMQSAIVTVADLPQGFAETPDPGADLGDRSGPQPSGTDRSRTDPPRCADVLAPIADQRPGALTHAVSRFGGPAFASIDVDAASYPGSGAADAFAAVGRLFDDCAHYSGTDAEGVAVSYRVGAGPKLATIADTSMVARVQTDSEGVQLISDVVLAVVGSTVVQVTATGQQPIDPKVLAGLAGLQAGRLRNAPGA